MPTEHALVPQLHVCCIKVKPEKENQKVIYIKRVIVRIRYVIMGPGKFRIHRAGCQESQHGTVRPKQELLSTDRISSSGEHQL